MEFNRMILGKNEIVALISTDPMLRPVRVTQLQPTVLMIENEFPRLHFALLYRYRNTNIVGPWTPFTQLESIEVAMKDFRKYIREAKVKLRNKLKQQHNENSSTPPKASGVDQGSSS
jgi:hypothetical protein